MKNILIIDAGLKPGWTKKTADRIIDQLNQSGTYAIERVNLREQQIEPCHGCALCLDRGEEKCKYHSDDTEKILAKLIWADGIITITPNYALQVPWILKNMYDRLAFVFHRPRLFHKTSMAIVVQGVYGGKKIMQYIDELMTFWGCKIAKGTTIAGGLYPNSKLSEAVTQKNDALISKAMKGFEKELSNTKPKQPTLFRVILFRASRSSMCYSPEVCPADKAYYSGKGWFTSKYYYDVKLNPISSAVGAIIDKMIQNTIKKDLKNKQANA